MGFRGGRRGGGGPRMRCEAWVFRVRAFQSNGVEGRRVSVAARFISGLQGR